jgi:hypothetical protein
MRSWLVLVACFVSVCGCTSRVAVDSGLVDVDAGQANDAAVGVDAVVVDSAAADVGVDARASDAATIDAATVDDAGTSDAGSACGTCGAGMRCGYSIADGCSATPMCVTMPAGSPCGAILVEHGCGCDGTDVMWYGGCHPQYPNGYAPAPITHTGACP